MKPFSLFCENPCPKAMSQWYECMKESFVVRGALMPDVHAGYVLPVGSAVLTELTHIVPSWAGYDIGCGMLSAKLDIPADSLTEDQLIMIRDKIVSKVPLGFDRNSRNVNMPELEKEAKALGKHVWKIYQKDGGQQLGTLGGGNHFIEIGQDDTNVWITIHSGSRHLGHSLATYYMDLAAPENCQDSEATYPLGGERAEEYYKVQNFASKYAVANRMTMLKRVLEAFDETLYEVVNVLDMHSSIHNNVTKTEEGYLHRKGATVATEGTVGIIPGNMRDGVFLVVGKGSVEGLDTCSHGAGREMSRSQAKKQISKEEMIEDMTGIVTHNTGKTDEAPRAYKDIFKVLDSQSDLVDVINHLKPLINIKG